MKKYFKLHLMLVLLIAIASVTSQVITTDTQTICSEVAASCKECQEKKSTLREQLGQCSEETADIIEKEFDILEQIEEETIKNAKLREELNAVKAQIAECEQKNNGR